MSWDIERHPEHSHVAVVTMNTNPVNAQNPEFFGDLQECFDRLERDYAECSVVLSGRGTTFSAGLDFDFHFPLFASGDREAIADWFDEFRPTNLRVFTYPRPTVAAVNGNAFAGGLLTALACDYRVGVDEGARFGLNEVGIGMPFPATFVEILRYATGTASVAPATLFARDYSPQGARRVGFLHELTESETVLDRAVEIAATIPPECFEAYAFTKRAFQQRVLDAIERLAGPQDREDLPDAVSADGSVRAHARQYREVTGEEPHWEV